ncbi:hypothetical protein [Georgenia yuyongxinii]
MGTDPQAGDRRGRFDTIGSTLYFADSRQCAYAEVLTGHRKELAAIAKVAETIGMSADEYVAAVLEEARKNGVDVPWAITVDWQLERSIYEIRLPSSGWWVQIDHPQTLAALAHLVPTEAGVTDQVRLLTSASIEGEDRGLTTLLAHVVREMLLDDGSEPLGLSFRSKTLQGRCWAYWDRRADANLAPGSDDLVQLISQNVGPDPVFKEVAKLYDLPVLPARNRT